MFSFNKSFCFPLINRFVWLNGWWRAPKVQEVRSTRTPIITGDQLRPDIVSTDASNNSLFMVELTVGFETRIRDNSVCESSHHKALCNQWKNRYVNVKFINLSMGAIGVIGNSSHCFYDLSTDFKDLKLDETHKNFLVREIISSCIRTTYYLFCKKDKQWSQPQLLFY